MKPVGGGGGVLVSNNCFLQQNTTASLLELYFNDSMQTVYACGGSGSQHSTKRGHRWGRCSIYRHQFATASFVVCYLQCGADWHMTYY